LVRRSDDRYPAHSPTPTDEIAVARNSGGRSSHRDVDLKPHTKKPGRSRDPASQAVRRVVDQNFMLAWM
jgi:hypothetical protein